LQDAHSVIFAEMVKGERTKYDTARNVLAASIRTSSRRKIRSPDNPRSVDAQFRWSRPVDRSRRSEPKHFASRKINDQARDIARSGGNVQNSRLFVWLQPTAQKMSHQWRWLPNQPIKRAQIGEIAFQFARDRLGPVHQFRHAGSNCRFTYSARKLRQLSGNSADSTSLAIRPSNAGSKFVLVP
jgi:hypothetical protein